ncbi:MAG: ATP-binding protein [Proteobacteria bacterium]|nr:ATP-binding protein [Pseudomonadota bacterium]
MFQRALKKPLKVRKSFFLFGPRGTGKTTWLHDQVPDALFINLLQSEFYNRLSARPAQLRSLIPPSHLGWIVIDEVQRVPELLNEVHDLIESQRRVFALTGSSARKLRREGVNLLAGRALTYHMHALTASEQGNAFRLENSVSFGNLPARFSEPDPAKYLKDYVQTYLRQEVLQEGLIRNIAPFSRFLEAASFSQGSIVNASEVAREAHIERSVVENYFSLLEDLLIAVRLPVFSKKAKRKLITHSKFYYFDAGVFRAIRPSGPLDSNADIDGPALATLVLQELRAVNDYGEHGYELYFWRTRHGLEVDFVLYGSKGLLAIEVKRSANVHSTDLRGLKEFKQDYPAAHCYFLYGGTEPLYMDKIIVLPLDRALRNLDRLLAQPGTDLPRRPEDT